MGKSLLSVVKRGHQQNTNHVTSLCFSLILSQCYSVLSFLGGTKCIQISDGRENEFPLVASGDTAVGVFQMQTGALCVKCNDYFG